MTIEEGNYDWLKARRRALYRTRPRKRDHWEIEGEWQKRVNSDILGIMRIRAVPKNVPVSTAYKISRLLRIPKAIAHYRILVLYLKYKLWERRN